MFGIDDAVMLGGAALSFDGGFMGSSAAKDAANIEKQIAGQEVRANQVREQAMDMNARRSILQSMRQAQMARSVATLNATSQGAQYGSGLAGGIGTISGGTGTNILGINQNLMFGHQMFDIDANISNLRMGLADAQSSMSSAQGLMSFGSSLSKLGTPLSNLSSVNWGSLFSNG